MALRRLLILALLFAMTNGAGLLLAGAVTNGVSGGLNSGGQAAILERGKRTYFTRCAQCHSAIPVTRYSLEQWDRLLPGMVRKSKLDAIQASELSVYVKVGCLPQNHR